MDKEVIMENQVTFLTKVKERQIYNKAFRDFA